MCGIIGFISKKNLKTNFYNEKFNIYHNKLFHRGPDLVDSLSKIFLLREIKFLGMKTTLFYLTEKYIISMN